LTHENRVRFAEPRRIAGASTGELRREGYAAALGRLRSRRS
jgi:hypothetical protein